jgi:hypothetical protein
MVTMDSDFLALADQGMPHAGVAYANPRRSVGDLISSLMLIFDVLTQEEMQNHVEYV